MLAGFLEDHLGTLNVIINLSRIQKKPDLKHMAIEGPFPETLSSDAVEMFQKPGGRVFLGIALGLSEILLEFALGLRSYVIQV